MSPTELSPSHRMVKPTVLWTSRVVVIAQLGHWFTPDGLGFKPSKKQFCQAGPQSKTLRDYCPRKIAYFCGEDVRGAYGAAYGAAHGAAYGAAYGTAYGGGLRGGLRGGLWVSLQAGFQGSSGLPQCVFSCQFALRALSVCDHVVLVLWGVEVFVRVLRSKAGTQDRVCQKSSVHPRSLKTLVFLGVVFLEGALVLGKPGR